MRKILPAKLMIPLFSLALMGGCGLTDDFQAGNRLLVQTIVDANKSNVPIFNAVMKTDDSGRDGDPATIDIDGSQGDGFPDPGEKVLTPLSDDLVTVTLKNEPRLGVEKGDKKGVDLLVHRVDVTYVDANGNSRTFAPTQSVSLSQTVPDNGTVDMGIVLIPVEMKANGLQGIFLSGDPAKIKAVRTWTVFVDVYATDLKNNDEVHAQGVVSVRFINPMVEEVAK